MKVLLAILASVLFFTTGCDEIQKAQQDPLADSSGPVKNAQKPVEKPAPPKPMDKEALQIDAPSLVNGRVGVPVEFKISGRVLYPNINFQMVIENLAEFPGATYDAQSGKFTWTPGKEKVAGYPSAEFTLNVSLITERTETNPAVSQETKQITIVVLNEYTKPIVNAIGGESVYVTGRDYKLDFTLEDLDAVIPGEVTVVFHECTDSYRKSIAPLLKLDSLNRKSGSTFEGQIRLRLGSMDGDDLRGGQYCFGVTAVSKFGVKSGIVKKELEIETKFKPTVSTLPEFNVTPGTVSQMMFSIYEPNFNGTVSFTPIDDIKVIVSAGSSLECNKNGKAQMFCLLTIDATTLTDGKTFTLNYNTDNTSPRQNLTTKHRLQINVKAANP